MSDEVVRQAVAAALCDLDASPLAVGATSLLAALGYRSDRSIALTPNSSEHFLATYAAGRPFRRDRALVDHWTGIDPLFQLTAEEITMTAQTRLAFEPTGKWNHAIIESYLFFAIELKQETYTRTQLAELTREINRLFPMPVMLLIRHGRCLTVAVINRRLHKKDESKDVLEKVTLIKDINLSKPHRAHVEILSDLALPSLLARYSVTNFVQLHEAWQKTLDSSELNRRFFREVANWYFWASRQVTFPKEADPNKEVRNATSLIRLITRLIFCWFIKEKGLIPDDLFRQEKVRQLLTDLSPKESTYYKAILQNLFFATLNQEMGKRVFRKRTRQPGGRDQHYLITNLYRYEALWRDPAQALELLSDIPFLNGGLFECLDKEIDEKGTRRVIRIDGFSDRDDNDVSIPNLLFFGEEQEADLNEVYGTTGKRYKVSGLLHIFDRYKFTVHENTPIEEEVALDPELLGKVFENLLASYNPETQTTARKQTGSFYTPREVVNYMVDEALIAYLESKLTAPDMNARLRHLLAYNDDPHQFSTDEVGTLIEATDHLKILDPACGSGAFPMGILHKLVFILGKLDPGNERWKAKQIEKASEIPDITVREKVIADIEQAFGKNELDYGRKLYLIEHCVYGVDIQPIAVQIAKLRCFISLVVDQREDQKADNLGIRPLPNLETQFVAANTLIGIDRPGQQLLRNQEIDRLEGELRRVRDRHFNARTPATKRKYREEDAVLRRKISTLLEADKLFPHETAEQLAKWDPYDQNACAAFFDPEWMFGVQDGFHITVGNPPYVRADEQSEWNQCQRQQILASKQYETLWEKWDLFVPFIERAYKLLKPGGVTTLIVSDAFCHAKYAQKPQNWFLKNARILRLDFCSDLQIFDAAVHNLIYLFQRSDSAQNVPERRVHMAQFGNVALLPSDEQTKLTHRAFFPEEVHCEGFSNPTLPIGSICYISYGLRPSSDEHEARGEFVTADLVSPMKDEIHCKPYVEGKHLANWLPATNLWLEWGTARAPARFCRPTFPEMYEVSEKIIAQRSPGPAECVNDFETPG
ncbi:Eco57I restriction-modification methylase, partial [Candidatus Methylomirabilis lanthanidiphila]